MLFFFPETFHMLRMQPNPSPLRGKVKKLITVLFIWRLFFVVNELLFLRMMYRSIKFVFGTCCCPLPLSFSLKLIVILTRAPKFLTADIADVSVTNFAREFSIAHSNLRLFLFIFFQP